MKAKTVKLIVGVAAIGALSGAYVGVKNFAEKEEAKEAAEEEADSVSLTDIGSDSITSVSYTVNDEEVTLTKEDDTWKKEDEEDFPLSQSTVESAVEDLASLSAEQKIEDVEDLSEYDLDSPVNKITIKTDDDEEVAFDIGMENSSDKYYIKKTDDDSTVYLVDSTSISPFMNTVYDLAEAEEFPTISSSAVKAIDVEKEDEYSLKKNEDTLAWEVSDQNETNDADSTAVSDATSAVAALSYDRFVDYNCTDESEYGLDDPYAVITVTYTEEEEVSKDEDDSSEDTDTEDTDSEDADVESTDSEDTDVEDTDTENTDSEGTDEEDTDTEDIDSEGTDEEDTDTEDTDSEDADEEDTDLEDADDTESSDDADSDDDETETVTVEKTVTITIGDQIDSDRYVKVDDSNQIYTMTEDSLTELLDKTSEDFYSMSVGYISASLIDSLDIKDSSGDTHTIEVTREVTEEESDSDDEDGETTTTTTSTYTLDGEEIESSDFSTFYNKLINMTAQERLTEEYTPEGDAAYAFSFNESDGTKVEIDYYEYDSSFYAAVVDGEKVYLVNKMDVRDLENAYNDLLQLAE